MTIWGRIIPANLAVAMVNIIIVIPLIPFGVFRSMGSGEFLAFMLSIDALAWLAVFVWFGRDPIDI